MDIFLQQMINGLTAGSVYAVVALGYTMVYGIIGLINFAHGEVVMIGAMVAFTVLIDASLPAGLPPLALLAHRHALRDPGLHAGRLRDGAARLPAAARRAAPGAAHHRDRRVDHPAAPGADRSGAATSWRFPRSSRRGLTSSAAPPSPTCSSASSRSASLLMGGARAAGVPHAARHRDARDRAEPAGRRPDGHRHQPRHRLDVRDRRRRSARWRA